MLQLWTKLYMKSSTNAKPTFRILKNCRLVYAIIGRRACEDLNMGRSGRAAQSSNSYKILVISYQICLIHRPVCQERRN